MDRRKREDRKEFGRIKLITQWDEKGYMMENGTTEKDGKDWLKEDGENCKILYNFYYLLFRPEVFKITYD